MCPTTTEYIQVLTFKLTDKNDGIHTVTERKLSQSQVNKVLKYGVYAKAVELRCFKPALNNNGTFSIEIAK